MPVRTFHFLAPHGNYLCAARFNISDFKTDPQQRFNTLMAADYISKRQIFSKANHIRMRYWSQRADRLWTDNRLLYIVSDIECLK